MKTYFKILLVTILFATGCSPSYMGASLYGDDIYYDPTDAPLIVQKAQSNSEIIKKENPLAPTQESKTQLKSNTKNSLIPADDRDFSEIQKQYSAILENDSIGTTDTLIYQAEESGYYIGGFTGSNYDKDEAERLREMYPQGFGYYDGSGYSLAMWLAGDSDWNVYIDGNNVWWTPTWTNYQFYNSYNFHTMRYGNYFAYNYPYGYYSYGYPSWNIGFGWDPWYWDIHFGWGFHNHHYWGHPYGYYNYGHHHHYAGHYNNSYSVPSYRGTRRSTGYKAGNIGNESLNRRSNAIANTNAISTRRSSANTKATEADSRTSRRFSSGTSDDIRRSRAAERYSSSTRRSYNGTNESRNSYSSTRRTVDGNQTTRTRFGNQSEYGQSRNSYSNTRRSAGSSYNDNNNTRRTSSPSYNKTRSATRPSYNSTNNSSNRRSNFSGTSSNNRSSYSKVRTNRSNSNYKSGSSNSSRSSGSSYRSSGSSNNSSGSYRSSGSSGSFRSSGSSSSGSSRSSGNSSSSNNSTRRR